MLQQLICPFHEQPLMGLSHIKRECPPVLGAVGNHSGDVQGIGHDAAEGPVHQRHLPVPENSVELQEVPIGERPWAGELALQETVIGLLQDRLPLQAFRPFIDPLPVALKTVVPFLPNERRLILLPVAVCDTADALRAGKRHVRCVVPQVCPRHILDQDPPLPAPPGAAEIIRGRKPLALQETLIHADFRLIGFLEHIAFPFCRYLIYVVAVDLALSVIAESLCQNVRIFCLRDIRAFFRAAFRIRFPNLPQEEGCPVRIRGIRLPDRFTDIRSPAIGILSRTDLPNPARNGFSGTRFQNLSYQPPEGNLPRRHLLCIQSPHGTLSSQSSTPVRNRRFFQIPRCLQRGI